MNEISGLPNEVLINIYRFLNLHTNNTQNRLVCHRTRQVIEHNDYWRNLIDDRQIAHTCTQLLQFLSSLDKQFNCYERDVVQLKDIYFITKKKQYYLGLIDRSGELVSQNVPLFLIIVSLIITLWLATRCHYATASGGLPIVQIVLTMFVLCIVTCILKDVSDHMKIMNATKSRPLLHQIYEPISIHLCLQYILTKLGYCKILQSRRSVLEAACYFWSPTLTLLLLLKLINDDLIRFSVLIGLPAILFAYCFLISAVFEVKEKEQIFSTRSHCLIVVGSISAVISGLILDQQPGMNGTMVHTIIWTVFAFIKMNLFTTIWRIEESELTLLQQIIVGFDCLSSVVITMWTVTLK